MSAISMIVAKKYGGGKFLEALVTSAIEGHLCLQVDQEVFPSFGEADEQIKKEARSIDPIVVQKGSRYYLRRNYEIEQRFFKQLERLSNRQLSRIDFEDSQLDSEQEAAVQMALSHPLSIISGGPGTGKSFTAAKLIEASSGSIAVAAPTGKATANLGHLKNCTLKTLHSLLSKKRQLPYDLVVVDEGSMIDAQTMTRLFEQLHDQARLVILGDRDQLPPVDTGHFFADLTEMAPTSYLTKCHRAELQSIVDLSTSVKRGEMIPFEPLQLPDLPQDVTLLTPLRKGPFGVLRLNEYYKRSGPQPIMITENLLGFSNGQTGVLYPDGSSSFGVSRAQLPRYEPAYVLSVHKSQGSEYDRVWLLVPPGSERFGREMLYTAITRAKKEIRIFADKEALMQTLAAPSSRLSLLS
ncbi:MAG: RecBCD enzyme subunit RecD [Chlamydiales bacterium]|nr:RecBCD enzyme subunit RecD [Chlamydiales bacterium]MCH9635102.1 RecBCD enzyme subunit RecD [Chlamydiales bacterium]